MLAVSAKPTIRINAEIVIDEREYDSAARLIRE